MTLTEQVKQNHHHYSLKQDMLLKGSRVEKFKDRVMYQYSFSQSTSNVTFCTHEAMESWRAARVLDKINTHSST